MKCCGHIDGQVKHLYQHIKVYISFIGQTEMELDEWTRKWGQVLEVTEKWGRVRL
jgi:hypothetical protein